MSPPEPVALATWSPRWRRAAELLGMGAAYYLVGRLGLLLAIPPGYATAVWPPSGIALAGALLFGRRVWPGIVLGSFAVNVGTSLDTTSRVSLAISSWTAISIGLGASMQAVLGASLIRRFVGYPTPLRTGRDVLTFLILGGPVACLTNATWGVTTLFLAGVIETSDYLFHWWTWWVGDTIGVMAFAPLVLVWTAPADQVSPRRRIAITVPLSLALASIITFFALSTAWERDRVQLEFERRTDALTHILRQSLDGHIEVLQSVGSLVASSPKLQREQFRTFVSPLMARHPGIQALSWNPRVPDSKRATFERAAPPYSVAGFRITELDDQGQLVRAGRRPEYVAVQFVEPHAGNERALGFDVASSPARREALDHARDTGQPAATDSITLVQESAPRSGFLVFVPVYRPGGNQATVEDRQLNVLGYATGAFRIASVITASLEEVNTGGVRVQLYDETAPGGRRLLYDGLPRAPERVGLPRQAVPFDLAGRRWMLHFAPAHQYLATERSWQSWSVLAGGMLFAGLLGAFLLVVTGRTAQLQAVNTELQREMTERQRVEMELTETEERASLIVAEALDAVITIDTDGIITSWNPQAERLFGWPAAEVLARRLSDTIIPPAYREAHERGLAHFRATGAGPVLGRRLELTALHRQGATFPVELAITRVSMKGRVAFSAFLRDISDRKRAESALAESVATFRLLFESNPLPMWVCDVDTMYFLEVNVALVAQCGYSREDFLRMRLSDIHLPEDNIRIGEAVAALTPGTMRHLGVWKHRLKDGRVRAVELKAHAIDFARRRAALFAASDVTDRQRAEASLETYAQRMRILHEIDGALIAGMDREAVVAAVLEPLRTLLGVPRVMVVLFDLAAGEAEWLAAAGRRRIHQGPGVRYSLDMAGDLEALRRGEAQVIDVTALQDSPEARALLESDVRVYMVVPMIVESELIGGLCFGGPSHDFPDERVTIAREVANQMAIAITQARLRAATAASESRFRALVEGSIQGLYIHGEDMRIRYANAAAAAMFGYQNPSEVVGRSILELYALEGRDEIERRARARLRDAVVPNRYEARGLRADGTPIWLDLLLSSVVIDGEPLTQVALVDISERRRAEEQLRQAQKMEAIGRLAGGVAHDFNNLLTVIMGRAEILSQHLRPNHPGRRNLELIQETAERAAGLTRQLLIFSRQQILEPKVVSLGAIVVRLEPMLRRLIGEDVDLVVDAVENVGRVKADPGQLEQVVLNLVVNARDAMPQGGRLAIAATDTDLLDSDTVEHPDMNPGPYVRLVVSDTGMGMDAATQAKLFEPFFTTKEAGSGTGLGLATVYGIVKQSGGHVTVDSEPGRGSTFTVYLPRFDGAAEPADAPASEAPRGRGSETILLVEDEEEVRVLAAEILALGGYAVLQARGPHEALLAADRHDRPIDMLVTDVVMPGMGGRELSDRLRAMRPQLKVLFMSGYTDDVMVHHGVRESGTALLQKPFTPDALLRKIRDVLDQPPPRRA